MRKIILFLTFFITQYSYATDVQKVANDTCSCLKEPYIAVEKMLSDIAIAKSSGDFSKIKQAQAEMMGVVNASQDCFEKLPKKYPEIDTNEELQAEVTALVRSQCPNPARNFKP